MRQGWKTQTEIDLGKYYRAWCEILPGHNDYTKLYKSTTKVIEIIRISQKIYWYSQQVFGAAIIF